MKVLTITTPPFFLQVCSVKRQMASGVNTPLAIYFKGCFKTQGLGPWS